MSTFDSASLVMIPSGYKDQKIYSVKPTDGTGDLTFSRASGATRVASNGLIEKVRENLILQSQDFTTTWGATSATVTANTTANPLNGVVNADTITLTGATTQKYVAQAFVLNGTYTTSVYLKAGTHQFVQLMLGSDPTPFANFDLVNGTASATGSTATIVAAGGGFFRCSMSFTSVLGTTVFITAADSLATSRFQPTASTGTYIAFGYQLETGDIATDYIATTTAAVSVGPVSGLPRLDYLNSTCPKLLLEPQRTNLLTYSEQIDNANWGSFLSASVAANTTISPDGYQNADTITFGSDPSSLIFQSYTSTSSTFTLSVYAKSSTGKKFCFRNFDGVAVARSSDFTTTSSWQRFSFTFTSALSNVAICNEIGGTVGDIQVYGCQLEVGAYATSYIPTLGASVTRVVDAASKTSASALIGQTEGTIFWEFEFTTSVATGHETLLNIDAGSFNNTIYISKSASGAITAEMYNGGVLQASLSLSSQPAGTYKTAIGYANNNTAFFVNGVQVGTTDTSCSVPAMSRIQLGNTALGPSTDKTAQVLLFPTRLTNSQLAELTA